MIEKKMKKYDFIVGIPCSELKDFTDRIENYIPCSREDEAMALAIGAWFVGKNPLVFIQNSGLGNIVDIVTSLIRPYCIEEPELLISIRRNPFHHAFMGSITVELLELLGYEKYRSHW